MNDEFNPQHSHPEFEEQVLDKLVDGELGEAQRKQLLMTFESRPEGWRHCALACLEAQAIRESCRGRAAEGSIDRVELARRVTRSDRSGRILQWIGTAASILCVFSLGMALDSMWRGGKAGPEGMLAGPAVPFSSPVSLTRRGSELRDFSASSSSPLEFVRSAPNIRNVSLPSFPQSAGANRGDGLLDLTLADNGGRAQTMRVPLKATPASEGSWLTGAPLIPAAVRDALQRQGHVVNQRRTLLPIKLPDGRQALVPIDQAEVQYLGSQMY